MTASEEVAAAAARAVANGEERQRIADQWAGIYRRHSAVLSLESVIAGAAATYETERARVGEQVAKAIEDVVAAHVYRTPCGCRLCRVVRDYRSVVPAAKEGR